MEVDERSILSNLLIRLSRSGLTVASFGSFHRLAILNLDCELACAGPCKGHNIALPLFLGFFSKAPIADLKTMRLKPATQLTVSKHGLQQPRGGAGRHGPLR